MALRFLDRVRFLSATTGTGALAIGAAIAGFVLPVAAGMAVNDTAYYTIEDGTAWEVGLGTLSASTTLTRTTVLATSNGNTIPITLDGSEVAYLCWSAEYAALLAPLASPAFTGTPTTPQPATNDVTGKIASTNFVSALATIWGGENVGRNKLLNPLNNIAQRGAGPFTTNGYCLDQIKIASAHSTGSFSVSQVALTDADRTAIGDEEAEFGLAYTFTGGTGANDFDCIQALIEDVSRLSGHTVQISLWAKASSAVNMGFSLDQNMGSGGSPTAMTPQAGAARVVGTNFSRLTISLPAPSVIGKTKGTTPNTSYSQLNMWLSTGANYQSYSGGIGVQSNTITIYGRQLEINASLSTTLEKPDQALDLMRCQRYYNGSVSACIAGYASSSIAYELYAPVSWPAMRALPTAIQGGGSNNLISSFGLTPQTVSGGYFFIVTNAGGNPSANYTYSLTSEL